MNIFEYIFNFFEQIWGLIQSAFNAIISFFSIIASAMSLPQFFSLGYFPSVLTGMFYFVIAVALVKLVVTLGSYSE